MKKLEAERVLDQCEFARECLEDEDDRRKFRLFWVAAVAMLRSVGHVLDKVDGTANPLIGIAARNAHRTWKQDPHTHLIFAEFIEDERNAVLKEARPGVDPVAQKVFVDDDVMTLDIDAYAPMQNGPYVGEDCRDVLKMAIDWWREQIEAIKVAADET